MKYIVNVNVLKEAGEKITNYSHDNLKENILKLYKIKRDMKWQGNGRNSFSDSFDFVIDRLYKMENALEIYGSFLTFSSEHYDECLDEMQQDWERHLRELQDKLNKEKIDDLM